MSQTVNLTKGQRIDLTKSNPGLSNIGVGLGWDAQKSSGKEFDLDAFVVCLDSNGKSVAKGICFYGEKSILNESIVHSGDNLTGVGDGDDETIKIDLSKIPADVDKCIIAVNIYEASSRNQNFGMVRNAFVRVYDAQTPTVNLLRYDLGEEYSTFQGVVFGELYRNNGEWKFGAVSNGFNGTINNLLEMY